MIPTFQPSPSELSRRARSRLEDAFVFLIQNAAEGDFTHIYDALDELKFVDLRLWRSLRAHYLVKSIFDLIDEEDKYRRTRPMNERVGA